MDKPASLRAAITAALPTLATNPDKLLVFVDEGVVVATATRARSFEYRYTANLMFLDFAGDTNTVMLALLDWVRVHEIDLMMDQDLREHGITFEVDNLNGVSCDLSIKLKLCEGVRVSVQPDGTPRMAATPEAVPGWWERSVDTAQAG